MSTPNYDAPNYDVIVFGASSFVGQIVVAYLAETFSQEQLRWAIAGRNHEKLKALIQHIPQAQAPDIVVADATNETQLSAMCQQTRVVVSTVGPFALYGENLVKSCVANGTDYCDITGEVHWVLQMISRYQTQAMESGARLFHCCGFDSIPSDLGVAFTQQAANDKYGKPCEQISMRVSRLKGRFSGGTYASVFNAVAEISANEGLRRAIASPYCLCPSDHGFSAQQPRLNSAAYDELTQRWICPFVMEGINTRIVHRSNALLGNVYGEDFLYDEALVTGKGRRGRKRATRTWLGLKVLMLAGVLPPLRWLMERFVVPKPGEGPSTEEQAAGFYEMQFFGKVRGRGQIFCSVTGDRDPGYGSTAKILAQVAYTLAKECPKGSPQGGFWTPAAGLPAAIIPRLAEFSGLRFSVHENGFEQ